MSYMDMDNLYKNQDILMFKECYALEKLHGCVSESTVINTLENGKITICTLIAEIKNSKHFHVLALDIENNEEIFAEVLSASIKQNKLQWYEIILENNAKIEVTGDHKIYCPEIKAYRKAEDLDGTEMLLVDN